MNIEVISREGRARSLSVEMNDEEVNMLKAIVRDGGTVILFGEGLPYKRRVEIGYRISKLFNLWKRQ